MSILIHNARILTLANGNIPRCGEEASDLSVIECGFVRCDSGMISHISSGDPPASFLQEEGANAINAEGRVVMPAFVDAHTHVCWAGDRLDEWDMKRAGASYLDILNSGGGIMSTVRAVRTATEDELVDSLARRLNICLDEGTTSIEIKSGYGLNTDTELKMLRAIQRAAGQWAGCIAPTALLGHAIDPDQKHFVDRTIEETLPAVHAEFPQIPIDAYCEDGAWSLDDCRRLFERAVELGHSIRIHADQFNSLGMTSLAVEMSAHSVDHLEATTPADLKSLATSNTFGVMLPACGFHLDDRYANGRSFMDLGGALVIASNCNPGSAPTSSMPLVIALAVRKLGLTIAEAITACTINAAALLGIDNHGVIRPGDSTDLIMLRHTDERMLAYELGGDPVDLVIAGGRVVKPESHGAVGRASCPS